MMTPTSKSLWVFVIGFVPASLTAIINQSELLWTLWVAWLIVSMSLYVLDGLFIISRSSLRCSVDCPSILYIGEEGVVSFLFDLKKLPKPTRGEGYLAFEGADIEPLPPQGFHLNPTHLAHLAQPAQPAQHRADDQQLIDEHRSVTLASGGRLSFTLAPRRRGTITLAQLILRWRGPLGFIHQIWKIPLDHEIQVVPNSRSVKVAALAFEQHRNTLHGIKLQQLRGEGSEFDQLKEYMQGLDHRAIDWKASARHAKLLVRSFRTERNHQLYLAFDTGRLMSESLDGITRLDHAINAGLILSYISLKCGDLVGICGFSDQVDLLTPARRGVPSFSLIESQISKLTYHRTETNFTLGMLRLTSKLKRRSLIIVFTDFVDSITAQLMLENTQRLAKRHVVVFVSFRDSTLDHFITQRPSDLGRLQESVVASELLQERERVFKELRRLGIYCIEASGSQIASRLINRYLEIKKRELI